MKKFLLIVGFMGLMLLSWTQLARAQNIQSSSWVTVNKDQTIDSTVFMFGRTIEIAGTVNGDVICAGMNITIAGTVNGDVICAGQSIRVSGIINGDVRLAGQNVLLSGSVENSASIVAQATSIDAQSKIGRDLTVGGADVTMSGNVGRDTGIGAENAIINGSVGRNLNGRYQSLILTSSASVGGNLDYTSKKDANIANGAKVSGSKTRHQPVAKAKKSQVWAFRFVSQIYFFLSLLIMSMVMFLLFPRLFQETSERIIRRPGRTTLVGLASLVVAPLIFIGLVLSLLGVPLAIFFGLCWAAILLLSGSVFYYTVGRVMFKNIHNKVLVMLLGSVFVLLLYALPLLSFLALVATGLFGVGSLVDSLFMHSWPRHYANQHKR